MTPEKQRTLLAEYTDLLRLSMAGNLRDFEVANAAGQALPGRRLLYNGVPAGYAVFPEETIQYAACHDNETLFDQARPRACMSRTHLRDAACSVHRRPHRLRSLLERGVVPKTTAQYAARSKTDADQVQPGK